MVSLLLRIAARCARRHFHLSIVAAPISNQYLRTPAASAVQRSFWSDSGHSPPGERRRLKIYHDKADQALLEERDLQRLLGRHSKREAAVLPLIVEEIVFRRKVRMVKRFNTNDTTGIGYLLAVGPTTYYADQGKGERELMPGEEISQISNETAIGPTTDADEDKGELEQLSAEEEILHSDVILLSPQEKRVIFYPKAIQNEPTEILGWEEDSELKENLREVKPKCYNLLPTWLKRTYTHAAVELGDMCARGEMKGDDAYGLLKHISEDIEEDRSKEWDRYSTMHVC